MADLSKPFIVQVDASDLGLGAVLLQEDNGKKSPVAYASRKLKQSERAYTVIEKECLALVWAVQQFHRYLYGTTFSVETDHCPLRYLNEAKLKNARLMRWALTLQPYRFHITAIRGSENVEQTTYHVFSIIISLLVTRKGAVSSGIRVRPSYLNVLVCGI